MASISDFLRHQFDASLRSMLAWATIILACGVLSGAVRAQIPSPGFDQFQAPPDARWSRTTTMDVEAAYAFIKANHPAAASSAGDAVFVASLERGYQQAKARALQTRSFQGYVATLAAFANALGDRHIWSRPIFVPNIVRWSGLIPSLIGQHWVIKDADLEGAEKDLAGAELISCDGVPVDSFAQASLGTFRAGWRLQPQRKNVAPWLLLDEGNPFVAYPKTCSFNKAGVISDHRLNWRWARRDDLLPRLKAAIGTGAAGFGVRQVGDGWWIALQSLDTRAAEVVEEVNQHAQDLRHAPYVVLDMRGNTGGSDDFGFQIAKVLFSPSEIQASQARPTISCGSVPVVVRASPADLADMEFNLERLGPTFSPEARTMMTTLIKDTKAAIAAHQQFSGTVTCSGKPVEPKIAPRRLAALSHPEIIVLTDSACFSSCMSVTDMFRSLGAMQVGQTTDEATRYVNVWEKFLPSGYSSFSTLSGMDPSAAIRYGSFAPDIEFNGEIDATPVVEHWVAASVIPQLLHGPKAG